MNEKVNFHSFGILMKYVHNVNGKLKKKKKTFFKIFFLAAEIFT